MKLTVIGAGPGDPTFLTPRALKCLKKADVIYCTAERLKDTVPKMQEKTIYLPYKILTQTLLREKNRKIALLVSGDVGFYSISSLLSENLPGWELVFINGISSLQLMCARLGAPYDRVKTVSLHGKNFTPVPFVSYNEWTFFLTGGERKAESVLAELDEAGLGGVHVWVGENLTDPKERLVEGNALSLRSEKFEDLSVILIHNKIWTNFSNIPRDKYFERGKVPMTKEEIRAVSLLKLEIYPRDICWDIGAGTGSVSVAMAIKAREGMVYAIEKNEEAVTLLKENRKAFGAFNIVPVFGLAPDALISLPVPNAVFIGGSSGNMEEIIRFAIKKNPDVKIVINAITLETLHEVLESFEHLKLSPEISYISCARSELVAGYHMMKGGNPVYVISRAIYD